MTSPFYTMAEAAIYMRYQGSRAADTARQALRRHGVPMYRRGKSLLVRCEDLEEVMTTGRCEHGLARRFREMRGE